MGIFCEVYNMSEYFSSHLVSAPVQYEGDPSSVFLCEFPQLGGTPLQFYRHQLRAEPAENSYV